MNIVAIKAQMDPLPFTLGGWIVGYPIPEPGFQDRVLHPDPTLTGAAMDDGVAQFQIILVSNVAGLFVLSPFLLGR